VTVQNTNPNAFTFPATPTYYLLGGVYHTVNASIKNTQATSSTVVVLAVVHNAAGQTLEVTSSSAIVAAGSTISAYPVINLPSGTYSVNVFVWSTSGASLSQSKTVSITY